MITEQSAAVIDVGRLLVSPATNVHEYLKQYAAKAEAGRYSWTPNTELENGLLQRNDRLIDLGLAQYCGEKDVWLHLYQKAYNAPKNEQEKRYQLALRVACFANENLGGFLSRFPASNLEEAQVKALVTDGSEDELHALLANPTVEAKLIVQVYEKEGVFAGIDDRKHQKLVWMTSHNPRLVTDTSDEHGPDMEFHDLQRAFVDLMRRVPVHIGWLHIIRAILDRVIRGDSYQPAKSIEDVIDRWSKLPIKEEKEDDDYRYSDQKFKEETLYMMAALYGWYFESNDGKYERRVIGDLNSPSVVLRCAAYGTFKMTPQQVQQAADRDGDAFLIAAMQNTDLFWDKN